MCVLSDGYCFRHMCSRELPRHTLHSAGDDRDARACTLWYCRPDLMQSWHETADTLHDTKVCADEPGTVGRRGRLATR